MIENLFRRVADATGLEQKSDTKVWCKWVTRVDRSQPGAFGLIGDFIPDREIIYDISNSVRLILCCFDYDYEGDHEREIRVFKLHQDNTLERLDDLSLSAADTKGWGDLMKDKIEQTLNLMIADYVENLNPFEKVLLPELCDKELIAALEQRGYKVNKKETI